MQVASPEENQQLAAAAAAAAATVFCHFRVYYKLNIISIYIWIDSRLKGLSIESKNTHNGVLMKELCNVALAAVAATTGFCHFQTYYNLYHFPHEKE